MHLLKIIEKYVKIIVNFCFFNQLLTA